LVLNTVVNGIHKQPNQFTGGEGPTSGQETQISVNFVMPVDLPADQYFFRPEAALSSGNFLWLSAAGPPLFTGDLQSWIRNEDLKPDWERIGTDVTHEGPFNASFSLTGVTVPGPIVGAGLPGRRTAAASSPDSSSSTSSLGMSNRLGITAFTVGWRCTGRALRTPARLFSPLHPSHI
jgi:hypothetical protein